MAKASAKGSKPLPAHEYWVLQPDLSGGMLLAPIPRPSEDESWTIGQRFTVRPREPVIVKIRPGYEDAQARPFMGVPPLLSDPLADVLVAAGVSNLDLYDAVIQSADGRKKVSGYKAFNLIGLVEAADMEATRFAASQPSRFLDASIESLAINPSAVLGQLMFRLAEQTSAIVVHQKVRAAIETAGIGHIEFLSPSEFFS